MKNQNTKYYIRDTKYKIVIVILSLVIIAFSVLVAGSAQYFFVVDFTLFKSGELNFNSLKLLKGDEPIFPESEAGYSFKIRDSENKIIAQKTFNFEFKSEVDTSKGYLPVEIDRIDGFTRIPYHQNAQVLEVTDPQGKVLAQTPLKNFICKADGLCPAVCRDSQEDPDCLAQGRCGDGTCQTSYENEKNCASDCRLEVKPPVSGPQEEEPQGKNLFSKKDLNNFTIFLIIFLIVIFGAYIFLKKKGFGRS